MSDLMIPVVEIRAAKGIGESGESRYSFELFGEAPLHELLGLLELAKLDVVRRYEGDSE